MILDGGVGTELPHSAGAKGVLDEPLWGTRALIESPDAVLSVHREYVQAGCDVISTNTWGLASALATDGPRLWSDRDTPVHWMDVGRRGLRLARQAVHELGRDGDCAVAFSLNGDVDSDEAAETIRLLARLFADEAEPPDLVLLETLSLLTPTLDTAIEGLLGDRPARVAVVPALPARPLRRLRPALGRPRGRRLRARRAPLRGDGRRRAAHQLPPARPRRGHGLLPARLHRPAARRLSEPRLPTATAAGASTTGVGRRGVRRDGAALARRGRADHRRLLRRAPRAHRRRRAPPAGHGARPRATGRRRPPWPRRRRGQRPRGAAAALDRPPTAPPLPAAVPRPQRRAGRGAAERRAATWPGATSSARASARTSAASTSAAARASWPSSSPSTAPRTCARSTSTTARWPTRWPTPSATASPTASPAETVDLYPWVPEERYEVIVASLYQMPVDPFAQRVEPPPARLLGPQPARPPHRASSPRRSRPRASPTSCSSRSSPRATRPTRLAAGGFVAQASSTTRSSPSRPSRRRAAAQIGRVEELSDAYHLTVGEEPVMVAYLLEVRHAR